MNELEKVKEAHKALGERIEALEKVEEQEPKLRLEIGEGIGEITGGLYVRYGEDNVGYIRVNGRCCFLTGISHVDTILKWIEAGKPVDETEIEWKGGRYRINCNGILHRVGLVSGGIYDFGTQQPCMGCKDENIQRYPGSNTPVNY